MAELFEVIVVNDGSRGETAAVLYTLQTRFGARLRVIRHAENPGYGAALRSGLEAARYDLVFYTDGDGQDDSGELPPAMHSGIGLVNRFKLKRYHPLHRVFVGWWYNNVARLLFGIALRHIDCDFRLMRREVLRTLYFNSNTGSICVELVRRFELSGWGFAEAGEHHYPRLHGRSQFFRLRSRFATARQLADVRRLHSGSLWARS